MGRTFIVLIASAGLIGCGGKEWQVAALVGTAATLKTIQASQAGTFANQPNPGSCERVCGPCTFPCGDDCVPYGTLCAVPPGVTCWEGNQRSHGMSFKSAPVSCPPVYRSEIEMFSR